MFKLLVQFTLMEAATLVDLHTFTVADPGFPVGGGVDLVGGTWTPKAVTFCKFCMSK